MVVKAKKGSKKQEAKVSRSKAKAKKPKVIPVGTIRVEALTLDSYSKTKTGWKKINRNFESLEKVVALYKASGKFDLLIDTKETRFLKGFLTPDGFERGARIVELPNAEKLEKAFSLFAPQLRIHDQDSHDHWDVIYQNKGGTYSYVYTLEKRKAHRARKYSKVEEFAKYYHKLIDSASEALFDKNDLMAVPMYTLLKTYMRVGNEIYYKAHGHKGLSTLMKKDISITGDTVKFNFLAKDGVPVNLIERFPSVYIKRLQKILKNKKDDDFVFLKNGHLLHENDFKDSFKRYCGKAFYPHIVRSYYATTTLKKAMVSKHEWNKKEMNELFLSIAHKLGHRKFDKKRGEWIDSSTVTVNSYVRPETLEQFKSLVR